MAESPHNILGLSTELYMQIFSYLDPVHATCLGLASRTLYAAYIVLHKKLPLDSFTYECPIPSTNHHTLCFLYTHLEAWKPSYLSFCGGCHKFCRPSNSSGVVPPRERCHECSQQELDRHSPVSFTDDPTRLLTESQVVNDMMNEPPLSVLFAVARYPSLTGVYFPSH